jgi:AcrR family transcriptional regulator
MPSARVICLPTVVNRRAIARHAGVAYLDVCAHFRSTEALIAECCLHELRQAPVVVEFDASIPQRVVSQFRQLVEVLADEPRYGTACVRALMTPDASLQAVRDDVDAEIRRRVCAALGSGAWPEVALTELTDGLRALVEALHPAGS